jgi:hypothetical protein
MFTELPWRAVFALPQDRFHVLCAKPAYGFLPRMPIVDVSLSPDAKYVSQNIVMMRAHLLADNSVR